jgi:hypothetical protein
LIEVSMAAFFLALLSVAVWGFLGVSNRTVRRTDVRRETRFLMLQILDRVESADFVVLYQNFGVQPPSPSRIAVGLGPNNPLNVDESVVERLAELKWDVKVLFRFMTRAELGAGPNQALASTDVDDIEQGQRGNRLAPTESGVLPYQGAVIELRLEPRADSPQQLPPYVIRKPVYCPLILGRPGLTLAQCPALNIALQDDNLMKNAVP